MRTSTDVIYFLVTFFTNLSTRQYLRLVNKQWKKCIDDHPLHISEKTKINRLVEEKEKMELLRMAINCRDLSFLFWIKKKLSIKDDKFTIACFRIDKKFSRYSLIEDVEKWKSNVPKFKSIHNIKPQYIPVYFLWGHRDDLDSAVSIYDGMKECYNDNKFCSYTVDSICKFKYVNLLGRYFQYKFIKHGKVAKIVSNNANFRRHIGLFDDSRYVPAYDFTIDDNPIQLNDLIQNGLDSFYKSYWENLDYLLYFTKPYNFNFPFISLPQSDLFNYIPHHLPQFREWDQLLHFAPFFGVETRPNRSYQGWTIEKFRQGKYDKMNDTGIQNLIQNTLVYYIRSGIQAFLPTAFCYGEKGSVIENWMFEAYMFEFGRFLIQHKQMQCLKQMILIAIDFKFHQWIQYILLQMSEINWSLEEKIILHFKSKKLPKRTRECFSRICPQWSDVNFTNFRGGLYVWKSMWLKIALMPKCLKIFLEILVAIVSILFRALIVMVLWNWVIPRIFLGALTIDYFTVIALVIFIEALKVFGIVIIFS